MTAPATIRDPAGRAYVGVLDVSGWQLAYDRNGRLHPGADNPRLEYAAELGIAGVIARIGNGTALDESFDRFYTSAKAAGLPIGAYYYIQPNRLTPLESAELVAAWLDQYDLELPVMLDLEEYHGATLSPGRLGVHVRAWLAHIEQLTGRRPIVYAGAAFINDATITPSLADYDTIQPRYARNYSPAPADLDAWATWIRWDRPPRHTAALGEWEGYQFTSSGPWPAYGGPADAATDNVDLNVVHADAWARWTQPERPRIMTALHMLPSPVRVADTRLDELDSPLFGERLEVVLDRNVDGDPVPIPADTIGGAAIVTITGVAASGNYHVIANGGGSCLNGSPVLPANANTTIVNVTGGDDGRPVIELELAGEQGAGVDIVVDLIGIVT